MEETCFDFCVDQSPHLWGKTQKINDEYCCCNNGKNSPYKTQYTGSIENVVDQIADYECDHTYTETCYQYTADLTPFIIDNPYQKNWFHDNS